MSFWGTMYVVAVLLVAIPIAAHGQFLESEILLAEQSIFGLSPVLAALTITFIGIGLRVYIGTSGKPRSAFNAQALATSFIIGFFASVQLVIVALNNLDPNIDELQLLGIVIGQIAAVMGVDAGVKGMQKRATDKVLRRQPTARSDTQNPKASPPTDDQSHGHPEPSTKPASDHQDTYPHERQ